MSARTITPMTIPITRPMEAEPEDTLGQQRLEDKKT